MHTEQQKFVNYNKTNSALDAIETRRSLRSFLSTPVEQEIIEHILQAASRAPSGTNMQPWNVIVLSGAAKTKLSDAVCNAFDNEQGQHDSERRYYPQKWFEPFITRRRKVGWDLYGLLDIKKGDKEKMHRQHRRNFEFFDAPIGLLFTIHRDLETGSWLDYGMFLQNIMILAREHGLHTCPQAAWADYHRAIRKAVKIDDDQIVVCGMALGYANPAAIENSLVTERESINSFVTFVD